MANKEYEYITLETELTMNDVLRGRDTTAGKEYTIYTLRQEDWQIVDIKWEPYSSPCGKIICKREIA